MGRFAARLASLSRAGSAETEMAREMASHLALLEEDLRRRGLSPHEAALAARRAYGGVAQPQELHREARSFPVLEQLLQDLAYAARGIIRNPGFALAGAVTLALGIGVNTTLFTAYNAVVLKPLPFTDPERVVRVRRAFQSGLRGDVTYAFSWPE